MKDLRDTFNADKKPRREFNINIWPWFKKNWKNIVFIFLAFIVLNIIFNPINTATVFSNWVNDFIGTFKNNINF